MRKSIRRELGLDKDEWDRDQIVSWIKRTRRTVSWREDYGLIFKPRIGRETRRRFQEILQIHSKEDVEILRMELRK